MPSQNIQESNLDRPQTSVKMSQIDTSQHKEDWLGEIVGRAILPAQKNKSEAQKVSEDGSFIPIVKQLVTAQSANIMAERFYVTLNDNSQLDTLEITANLLDETRGYIINFPGNSQNYTHNDIDDTLSDLANFNCIYFNYRNVGKSEGHIYSSQDLINDGIAQVQRLIDKGIPPDLIYLYGFSLGGGISAKVYEHFQNKGILLGFCFNDRSFNNINTATNGSIKYISKMVQMSALSNPILGSVIGNIAKTAISNTQWDIRAQDAFANIPEDRKAGAFVKWHHKNNVAGGDGIISDEAMMQDKTVEEFNYSGELEAHNAHYSLIKNKDDKNPKEIFYEACKQRRELYLSASNELPARFEQFENVNKLIINPDNQLSLNKKLITINAQLIQLNEFIKQLDYTNFVVIQKMVNHLKQELYNHLNSASFIDSIAKLKNTHDINKCLPTLINLHRFLLQNKDDELTNLPLQTAIEKFILEEGIKYLAQIDFEHYFDNSQRENIEQLSSMVMTIHELLATKSDDEKYEEIYANFNKLSQKFYLQYCNYGENLKSQLNQYINAAEQIIDALKDISQTNFNLKFINKLDNAKQTLHLAKQFMEQNSSFLHDINTINERLSQCENAYLKLREQALASLKLQLTADQDNSNPSQSARLRASNLISKDDKPPQKPQRSPREVISSESKHHKS